MTETVPREIRDDLLERIQTDLAGPGSSQEVIDEWPTDRYLTGILFAPDQKLPQEENEVAPEAAGEAGVEQDEGRNEIGLHHAFRPSSMGLSFAVVSGTDEIELRVTGGRYRRRWRDPESGELTDEDLGRRQKCWLREPFEASGRISVSAGYREFGLEEVADVPGAEDFAISLRVDTYRDDALGVTLVLLNQSEREKDTRITAEQSHLFQARLRVETVGGNFTTRRSGRGATGGRDARVNELLYRDVEDFASGHTCSATWEKHDGRCVAVKTTWFPAATIFPTSHEGDLELQELLADSDRARLFDARWLAECGDPADLATGLSRLPEAYRSWIGRQQGRMESLERDHLQKTASQNLDLCERSAQRMEEGISLLERDDRIRRAFQIAQLAMALQHEDEGLRWRPFQIGFQLQTLASLADPNHDDRDLMDLLWFPTGGGKTEAYLALTAFILILRRLRPEGEAGDGGGVGVLTRYTLRLLTIQQFERSARLICALEGLRRGLLDDRVEEDLGKEPFRIGLWVGGSGTPNRREEAEASPREARLLVRCPWCRTEFSAPAPKQYRPDCNDQECAFGRTDTPLPVLTVDDDIYETPPSLLIGTIDKFAQLVRKGETGKLFGLDTSHAPPDFIIQDELHLISGPLGTIAGLYEAAVDMICERSGANPKVVGSTATIRRADEQVRALFDRQVFQFPPPALDADNSFFAKEDTSSPGRQYVGMTTAGRSAKYALQALSASALQGGRHLRNKHGPSGADPYWTLVSYFNSLRELGGALALMEDDVRASIEAFAKRHEEKAREPEPPSELTSRVASEEIPEILSYLENRLDGSGEVLDSVLATSMISVGVDVPRLGLMVVNGQPKTMAEYIQATSRVGRRHPGLILTLYNAMKTRDRSHYETFVTTHQALYREVEASSVTPFASRARDRALKGVLIGLVRHLVPGMREDPQLTEDRRRQAEDLAARLLERVRSIGSDRPGIRDDLRSMEKEIERILDDWEGKGAVRRYWATHPSHADKSLLVSAEEHSTATGDGAGWVNRLWPALNSMRAVEPSVEFRMKKQPEKTQEV